VIRAHRTLVFVVIAVLACGTAVLAAGHRFGWRLSGPAGPLAAFRDLPALAPADSNVIVFADVAELRTSPLLAQLKSLVPSQTPDADYTAFAHASGFDYQRDLDKVLFVSFPADGKNATVAIAEGRFDREKIRAYAMQTGKLERHSGVDIYLMPTGSQGIAQSKMTAFAFLSDTRIAISDSSGLDSFLAGPAPAPAAQVPTPGELSLSQRVSHVATAPLFMITHVPDVPPNWTPGGVHSEQLDDLAHSVKWIDLTFQPLPDKLHVTLEGECVDPAKAASLEGTLNGLRILAQAYLGAPDAQKQMDPQTRTLAGQLLDSAVVAHHDQWVSLSLDLTQDLLKSALQHAPNASNAPHSSPPAPPAPPK
jgi:hypothetical protein